MVGKKLNNILQNFINLYFDMAFSNTLLLLSAVLRTAFSTHFEGAIIQWRPIAVQSSGITVST